MERLLFSELAPVASNTARAAVAAADVVIGVDSVTQNEFTVYGMPSLESTVILNQPSAMRILHVLVDCQKKELDQLLILVREIKGLDSHRHARA